MKACCLCLPLTAVASFGWLGTARTAWNLLNMCWFDWAHCAAQILDDAEKHMVSAEEVRLPHRIVHLPMAFNEKWTHEAINRWALAPGEQWVAGKAVNDWRRAGKHKCVTASSWSLCSQGHILP